MERPFIGCMHARTFFSRISKPTGNTVAVGVGQVATLSQGAGHATVRIVGFFELKWLGIWTVFTAQNRVLSQLQGTARIFSKTAWRADPDFFQMIPQR